MNGPVLVAHEPGCTARGMGHSDAAKRVSDQYRLHKAALGYAAVGRWMAVSLADGAGGGQLYDCKRDAVAGQHHNETFYAFICISPGDMPVCEAEAFLCANRILYDAGLHMPDPDHRGGGRELITRSTVEDQASLMRSVASRGRTRPSNLVIIPPE